jgi:hypothetical protein
MTAPDPKTVREIAREIILDCGRNADDIGTYVWVRVGADLSKHEHGAWCSAIREAIRTAQITASWLDEQQPAETTGGEQAQDGAVGRLESWLAVPNHFGAQIEADLRAVLADRDALAARVAELEGEREALLDGNQRLQTMNEGLRQMAIQAREAANSWQQATIDLYSGREEPHPSDCPCGQQEASDADADVRAVSELLDAKAAGKDMAECKYAFTELRARFADRIAALDSGTDGGAK